MSLRVAVQMDPLERINVAGDSTFAIMLKAQELGHELYWYSPEDLSFAEWRLWTMGYPVTVQRVEGDHYSFGEPRILDLGEDVDVVLMRQDPPFDLGYITATHLLERIRGETLVVNDPASVALLARAVDTVLGPDGRAPTAQSLGGEDFAWYLDSVPGAMARLGTRTPGGPTYDLHQGDLRVDERAVSVGASVLAAAALTAMVTDR